MSPPRLVADRFLVHDDTRVIDLATGDVVLLRVERRVANLAEWAERCARLASLAHGWLAAQVDYGRLGEAYTFEAYRLVAAVGSLPSARRMAAEVQRFLRARGVTADVQCVAAPNGRIVVPAAIALDVERVRRASGHVSSRPRNVLPPAAALVLEHLRAEARLGLTCCDAAVARGAESRALTRHVAREARLAGWVPIALRLAMPGGMAAAIGELVAGRHLLVVHDARDTDPRCRAAAAAALARLAARTDRPILLVRLVDRWPARPRSVGRPRQAGPHSRAGADAYPPGEDRDWLVAREATTAFSIPEEGGAALLRPRLVSRGGHAAAVEAAHSLLARGRHAAAERVLRQAACGASRRGAAQQAATLWAAVARLLLSRGRAAAAAAALDEARATLEAVDDAGSAIECALLRGQASLLLLRAEQAEAAFRSAAVTAALARGAAVAHGAAARVAEGLWWLGHVAEAREAVRPLADAVDRLTGAVAIEVHAVLARLELSAGMPDAAASHVTRALDLSRDLPLPARHTALLARARWLATTGDCTGLTELCAPALAVLRREHAALAVTELRLLLAEGALRARDAARARAHARGLVHLAEGPTPPLVAARARLALSALARRDDAERLRDSLVARGFGAFASADAAGLALPPPVPTRSSPMLDAVLEMLRACQDEEPRTALARVAELLRLRCSATVVAIMAGGSAPVTIAVPAAMRPPVVSARRALDGGVAIDLHHAEAGQEAAVPMRHAGSLVGAVGCRWVGPPPGSADDVRRLLETAAAAAGPCARALEELSRPREPARDACELVGTSSAIADVRRAIARAADAPFAVLLEGESGVGKELAARAIHRASPRRHRPLCIVNGAALPDDLLEAELFGHTRGAFTGAVAERRGMFEEADGGDLFLDEVGELSPRAQAKLLRVVQEGEVRRLGETHVRHVDARLIAATNRVLETEVAEGRFRRDLFYRLAVIRIRLPPLRERQEDVPELAAALWLQAAKRVGSVAVLSAATLAALARYDWPGNVRELQNVLAALAVSTPRRGVIGPALLPAAVAGAAQAAAPVRLEEARRHFETRFVRAALARAGGHRGRAASDLGVTRQGLAKLIERLGIEGPESTGA